MKRIESFFLPDDDFVPDEEMIQAIGEVTSADSAGANMLPSDRVLKEIRSKEVQRGQFGIGNIFWIITALSFVCAAPNLFGFNTARYWMNVALFAWIFAPGWTYLSWWAVNSYEFSPAFHVMTGLLVVSIGRDPCFSIKVIWIFTVVIPLAAASFRLLFWLHSLLQKGNAKSKSINSDCSEAIEKVGLTKLLGEIPPTSR